MSINSISHSLWKDKRIQAMNKIMEKNNLTTDYFLDEYQRVTLSDAKTKKEYKRENTKNASNY
jgi:hypothetical protein